MTQQQRQHDSRWSHLAAVVLVCATFPLIWVGGLVTTTDAGMAFDDWPTTDGYFIFFYPLHRWFGSGWNPFIEHTHRVLGAVVGLLTITLAVVLWRDGQPKWLVGLGVAAVAAVTFQGALGGLRVIENKQTLAMIHGCVGPLFFALTVALAVLTSRLWKTAKREAHDGGAKFCRLAILTAAMAYLQLVLGAWLRHLPASAGAETFRIAVLFHLFMALAVTGHILMLTWRAVRRHGEHRALVMPAVALSGLLLVQLALGAGTWVTNYGWPEWFAGYAFAQEFLVVQGSTAQTLITTGHVAVGSLIFVVAVMVSLRSLRMFRLSKAGLSRSVASVSMEAAR